MMGIIKYPRYSMYWSPETDTPATADASASGFEILKRFLHNSQMPAKMVTNLAVINCGQF